MIVRPARAEDAAAVVRWFRDRTAVVLWAGPEAPHPLRADWLAAEFAAPGRNYFVLAGDEAGPVGVFGLRWFPGERRAHLIRVGLAPEVRGVGLGVQMLKAAERLARERGAERLTLNVYGANESARRAYEAAGFFVREFAREPGGEVVRMLKPLGRAADHPR